jgi:hypothetical protein
VSGRVKSKPRASQVEMSARTIEEHQEIERRRAQAEQQATREQLEQAARRQGWTVTETKEQG